MQAERHLLSRSGLRVPRILYGTAWKKAQTARWVREALDAGFNGIDTACQPKHYDEAGVGTGLRASRRARSELYLQTKFTPLTGQDPARLPYDATASIAEQVRQSFAQSLHNLGSNYLDCLLLHSPMQDPHQMRACWQALEALADSGQVGQLGLSNCYELEALQRLDREAHIKPAVLQNRFYAATGYDSEIRAYCRGEGIVYQSFWTLSANPQLLDAPAIKHLAQSLQRTPAQVLFRYLMQQDVVPLTGTTSLEHMQQSLAAFDFSLTEEEAGAITALL